MLQCIFIYLINTFLLTFVEGSHPLFADSLLDTVGGSRVDRVRRRLRLQPHLQRNINDTVILRLDMM